MTEIKRKIKDLDERNAAAIARMADRRKRLAGHIAASSSRGSRKRKDDEKVAQAVEARKKSHHDAPQSTNGGGAGVQPLGNSTVAVLQQMAKELKIKNRRWLNRVELEDAVACAHNGKRDRLSELEQVGRDRCQAAWEAWRKKKA